MKVKTPPVQGSTAAVCEAGATPVPRVHALRVGNDDKLSGQIWAEKAIALCRTQAVSWAELMRELLGLNIEQRAAALDAWKAWKGRVTKEFNSPDRGGHPALDEKAFKKMLNSATTRLSQLRTIARAWDAGMTWEHVGKSMNCPASEAEANAGIDAVYPVAQQFVGKKAASSRVGFKEALAKWLEKQASTLEEEETTAYNAVVTLVNSL